LRGGYCGCVDDEVELLVADVELIVELFLWCFLLCLVLVSVVLLVVV
jgi:hypothetical protein